MDAITLSVEIPENHHLILDLPADLPVGRAEVIIKPQPTSAEVPVNPAREAARAKLLAAGILSSAHRAPEGATELLPDERERIWGQLAGGRSIDDLIDEDREEY